MSRIVPDADVFGVGTGISGIEHLTIQGFGVLKSCERLFGFSDVLWLREFVPDFDRRFSVLQYPPVEKRRVIFVGAAKTIASAVLSGARVAYVTVGSPVRHVWLTSLLREWAKRENYKFKVILAPSSTDMVLDVLGIDDSAGLQIADASAVSMGQHQIDPACHCLLMNLEKVGVERSVSVGFPRPEMLRPLRDQLLGVYPPTHLITAIIVPHPAFHEAKVTQVPLKRLETLADLRVIGTLWCPPRRGRASRQQTEHIETLSELARLAHTPLNRELGTAASELRRRIVSV